MSGLSFLAPPKWAGPAVKLQTGVAKSGRWAIERIQTVEMQTIQSARESGPFTRTPNRARTPLHG